MRLIAGCGWSDVLAAATSLADSIAPFELPPISVQDLFGFLALRETANLACRHRRSPMPVSSISIVFARHRQRRNLRGDGAPI